MHNTDTTGAAVAYLAPHCARKYRRTGKNLYMELCPWCALARADDALERLMPAYVAAEQARRRALNALLATLKELERES